MERDTEEQQLKGYIHNLGPRRVMELVRLGMKMEEERLIALRGMPNTSPAACRTCRFYLHPGDVTPEPLPHGWGWCQRYPPTLIERVGSLVPVSPSAWCGEYQAR